MTNKTTDKSVPHIWGATNMYKNILNHAVWKFKGILFQRMLQDYKFNGIFDRKK